MKLIEDIRKTENMQNITLISQLLIITEAITSSYLVIQKYVYIAYFVNTSKNQIDCFPSVNHTQWFYHWYINVVDTLIL